MPTYIFWEHDLFYNHGCKFVVGQVALGQSSGILFNIQNIV